MWVVVVLVWGSINCEKKLHGENYNLQSFSNHTNTQMCQEYLWNFGSVEMPGHSEHVPVLEFNCMFVCYHCYATY